MTDEELNTEFSINITKTAGDPKMRFTYDGSVNEIGSGLVRVLAYLTAQAPNVDVAAEEVIVLYRELVREHTERTGRST
ncbi:MAG: hypothetical protein LUH45_04090 [Clostridiales bacterium]|nr:hypothetical protein [Clostridiales bacterium]